mmetsp:Transcript_44467/g.96725  ORF Transcript_44467/g.96725 Transcript_44467/m.96725 type:complete len:320 (+) Transcript_44467:82-1041(+)|eukprot:CAMPEP_0170594474 /NCGR_PEP_ID=MMETSP0224-20130122/14021_1 /TAXON_ID=285029 /ORGANISM="Togula jolla, Strain CCCM 725" /LENGTH=319 /DNA_ID=CAMNT_0010918537 /DNA_START=80 /DNA_END=1039 /DNA_ORIENTATION=+
MHPALGRNAGTQDIRAISPEAASSNPTSDGYELWGDTSSDLETPKSVFLPWKGAPGQSYAKHAEHAELFCKERLRDAEELLSEVSRQIRSIQRAAATRISSTRAWGSQICHKVWTRGPMACGMDTARHSYEVAAARLESIKLKALESYRSTRSSALRALLSAKERGCQASAQAAAATWQLLSDGKFQATAAAGAGGAVALGTVGGTAGLIAGTASGAALGLIPALFTFGLSIPVGAVLGGGMGLAAGSTVGSTVGAATGCAIGYRKEREIWDGAGKVWTAVSDGAKLAKGKTSASADYVKGKVSVVKAKLIKGGTGGTV